MTAEQRALLACKNLNLPEAGVAYIRILQQIQLAMKDQRHGCAEAVLALGKQKISGYPSGLIIAKDAHQAVMNAEPKES